MIFVKWWSWNDCPLTLTKFSMFTMVSVANLPVRGEIFHHEAHADHEGQIIYDSSLRPSLRHRYYVRYYVLTLKPVEPSSDSMR